MLFSDEPLQIKPARPAPLFYVTRFRFVDDDGSVIRDVPLEPGINIVWSKDEAGDDNEPGAPGHAAGKSLFVSLLRFALGGADVKDSTRERLLSRYPNARVAVDVVLDGEHIVIVRSVRHQMLAGVVLGAPVPDVREVQLTHRNADVPLHERLAAHLNTDPDALDWLTLIDLATRDQETRFDDVAIWRNRDGRDAGERHELLLRSAGLYSAAEHASRLQSDEGEEARKTERRTTETKRYVAKEQRSELRRLFKVDVSDNDGELLVAEALVRAAEDNLHRATSVAAPDVETEIRELESERTDLDRAIGEVKASGDVISVDRRKTEKAAIEKELEDLIKHRTETPGDICPVCKRVAENEHALAELRRTLDLRIDNRAAELKTLSTRIAEAEERQRNLDTVIAAREQERTLLEEQLRVARARARKLEFEKYQDTFQARQHLGDAKKHRDLVAALASDPPPASSAPAASDVRTESAVATRRREFRRQFAAIVRMLLGASASGTVDLKQNAVRLGIVLAGEKNSPAYRVMGVLAFDIAAMVARAEGRAAGPAFFVHDSPREADMSLVVYEKYFETLKDLRDRFGDFFQTIVTTTTPPPSAFKKYVRVELQGYPDEKRLLKAALG